MSIGESTCYAAAVVSVVNVGKATGFLFRGGKCVVVNMTGFTISLSRLLVVTTAIACLGEITGFLEG